MLFKRTYHKDTYKTDGEGAFKIPVALNKYEDIYCDFDPSPFRKRDIEEDFVEYIRESSLDIPFKEKISVVFLMDEKIRDEKKENQVIKALEYYYTYLLRKTKRAYIDEKKESITYLIIGIILGFIVYSGVFEDVSIWTKVFEEGVMVGTWVFFWEAFYNFFIESRSLKEEIKLNKRLLETDFIFKNKE